MTVLYIPSPSFSLVAKIDNFLELTQGTLSAIAGRNSNSLSRRQIRPFKIHPLLFFVVSLENLSRLVVFGNIQKKMALENTKVDFGFVEQSPVEWGESLFRNLCNPQSSARDEIIRFLRNN